MHCNFEVPQYSNAIIGVLLPFKGLLKTEGMLRIFHDKLVPLRVRNRFYGITMCAISKSPQIVITLVNVCY